MHKQKLIFIDLDGTLTPHSTWYELNMKLGITPEEDKELFERYLSTTLAYEEWNAELVRLYRSRTPVTKSDLLEFADTLSLRPEAPELIRSLKEKGFRVVVLSGSVDLVVELMAKKIGAEEWRSTSRLEFDENGTLINIVASGDEAPAKELLAEQYAAANNFRLADAYSIEDGGNGYELFKKTKGILLGDNEKLKPLAWKQVQALSEIPALL